MNINEIDDILKATAIDQLQKKMNTFSDDSRAGVHKLLEKYQRKINNYEKEVKRLEKMHFFENKYNLSLICGIDEAGRGPLAGPVVAASVILPNNKLFLYLNDSKQVSAKKRDILYNQIMEHAVCVGVGIVPAERIDEINILQATYEAMQKAVSSMNPFPELLLVDAVTIPNVSVKQVGIIKGDSKSVSIAAASIIAKVTRDRIMADYDILYPGFGFAKNKGYGASAHIEALKKLGACPIHRRTFIKNFV